MEIGQLLMVLEQAPSGTKATVEHSGSGGKEVFSQLLQLLMKEDASKLLSLLEDLANNKQFADEKDAIENLIKNLSKMQQETANDKKKMTFNSTLLRDVAFLLLLHQQVFADEPVADDIVNEETNSEIDRVDKVSVSVEAEDVSKNKVSEQKELLDINIDISSKDPKVLSEKNHSVKVDDVTVATVEGRGKGSDVLNVPQVHVETKVGQVSEKVSQVIEGNNVSVVFQSTVIESEKSQDTWLLDIPGAVVQQDGKSDVVGRAVDAHEKGGRFPRNGSEIVGEKMVNVKDNKGVSDIPGAVVQQDGKSDVVGRAVDAHEKGHGSSLVKAYAMEREAIVDKDDYPVKDIEGLQNVRNKGKQNVFHDEPRLESNKVEPKAYMHRHSMAQVVENAQMIATAEIRRDAVVDMNNMRQQITRGKIQDTQVLQPIDEDKYRITDPVEVVPITADEWEHTEKEVIVDKELLKEVVDGLIKFHDNSQDNKNNVKGMSQGVGKVVSKGLSQTHISVETKTNAVVGLKGAIGSVEAHSTTVNEENLIENKADEVSIEVETTVSENTEVKKEKSSDVVEARVHKHVEADIVKISTITNEDKQVSHEKQLNMRTVNSFAKAVETMKSKHKYPAYMAIRVNDNIVKMKLSFDIEKGEFLLEMMADKDMAKTLHMQKHLLVSALMERDIHVRDIKVYIANQSSMIGLRQDTKHMNWSFMGHSGSWHSYRQQHDYATWVREVYGNAHETPIDIMGLYSAPVRTTKGADINIYV